MLHQSKFDFNTLESPERVANSFKQHEGVIFKDFDSYLAKQQLINGSTNVNRRQKAIMRMREKRSRAAEIPPAHTPQIPQKASEKFEIPVKKPPCLLNIGVSSDYYYHHHMDSAIYPVMRTDGTRKR